MIWLYSIHDIKRDLAYEVLLWFRIMYRIDIESVLNFRIYSQYKICFGIDKNNKMEKEKKWKRKEKEILKYFS